MLCVLASLNLMFSLIKHLNIRRHLEWQKQENPSRDSKHPLLCGSLSRGERFFYSACLTQVGERDLQMRNANLRRNPAACLTLIIAQVRKPGLQPHPSRSLTFALRILLGSKFSITHHCAKDPYQTNPVLSCANLS